MLQPETKTMNQAKIMKTRHLVSLLCSLGAITGFAAPPVSEGPLSNLRSSRDVFDAFTSTADTRKFAPLVPAPMLTVPAIFPSEFRTIDGSGNNPTNLGTAGTTDLRKTAVGYGDGISTPAGSGRRGARDISNLVNAQGEFFPNTENISSYVWQWGQFLDHDMTNIRSANPAEPFNIPVPQGDPQFDPRGGGNKSLPFQRTNYSMANGVREQINANSAFIDASQVYGSDILRARTMRTRVGGRLATSDNNLMPFNVLGLANQPQSQPGKIINPADFFLAGDVRANETTALMSLHTIFMREHNFWADSIAASDPTLNDEGIYQRARAIVGAEIQLITYRDFLPILLGPNALTPYLGYNSAIDPRVAVEFSTAGFRVGHTFLPPVLMRFNSRGVSGGDLALGSAFFIPSLITNDGIEPWLRGLAKQVPQQVDAYIIDALRNFLIGGTRAQGFDLASLNIQRGRDHGLPSYNQVRIGYGLAPKATFAEMTSNLDFQTRLASAYSSPDDVDVWVGGLTEDHVNGGQIGETFFTIIKEQFERSRDGDRFWYESYLDPATLATVQAQTLGGIIKRNAAIGIEMQDDVFHVPANP